MTHPAGARLLALVRAREEEAAAPRLAPVVGIDEYRKVWIPVAGTCCICAHQWFGLMWLQAGESSRSAQCPACGQISGSLEVLHPEPATMPEARRRLAAARGTKLA